MPSSSMAAEKQQQRQQAAAKQQVLPPGFRFCPTDRELLLSYLLPKVANYPQPAAVILDIDILKFLPWDLPGDDKSERYFFTRKEIKYMRGNRLNRATDGGYWKATGREKAVTIPHLGRNLLIGVKRALVFYRGKPPSGKKTDWVMHEYSLTGFSNHELLRAKPSSDGNSGPLRSWALCRIFKKKRAAKMGMEVDEQEDDVEAVVENNKDPAPFIDFLARDAHKNVHHRAASPSVSGGSCVTDIELELSTDGHGRRDDSSTSNMSN